MAWSYYCSIELDWCSNSMSLHLIVSFMLHLNSSTNGHSLYSLPLATLLNFWTNSFIVFLSYSSLLNSTTFTDSLSPLPKSFLMFVKNFLAVSYSSSPTSKFSNIFSFHTFTNPPCMYERIYWICSSTVVLLILILMYNLHIITKPEIFNEVLSNTCGLAISVPVAAAPSAHSCSVTSCFYCCCTIAYNSESY